ncbi:MAG TPA: sulfatase [Membranihabitans sp.]|nr:sulfatase [Membranihabitans sp.]
MNHFPPCRISLSHEWSIFIWLTLFYFLIACNEDKTDPPPSNILFIAVDDLRPQLGIYGHEYMVTPHMDRLAREGRWFTHHFVNVPTCGPSRYTMLTSKYPQSPAELQNNIFEKTTALNTSTEQPESLADAFRRNGYYTVGIGKISHAADGLVYGYTDPVSEIRELPQSWDEFHFDSGKWNTGWNAFFGYADGENRQSMNRQVPPYEAGAVDDDGYPDGLTTQLAIHQIQKLKNKPQPFFLAVGLFKPHLPFNAPQKYWDMYDEENIPLTNAPDIPLHTSKSSFHESGEFNGYQKGDEKAGLDRQISPSYARKLKQAYCAAVSYADAQIGKIIQALETSGLADNTIIVVWGDHGWHLGDHRVWGKHTLSDYALRSTLIIKTPDMVSPGEPSHAIIESTDIYPTLLDLTHQEIPSTLIGQSFKNILYQPNADSDGLAYAYFRRGISMRTPKYRLTRYFRDEQPDTELYDYDSDPYERRNVVKENPQIVDSLMVLWKNGDTGLFHNQ